MSQWWKESVVYQIYPQSFKDSNGDGIGDLRGIINRLDYLKELGVDVVWLNPIYDSPLDDNGYDIRDYKKILEAYGTMEDFNELLEKMHQHGIKLLMDLVVNHTSDEHKWFVEARKSKDNKYRDYYIWKKSVNGSFPNEWQSFFGGDAWNYDEQSGEYYLRLFSSKQVDLNWDNPEVREEVFEIIKWWLDKGIDGFRMDVINLISKEFHPDNPEKDYFYNGPHVHEYLREMNQKVLSHYNIMSVGECPGTSTEDAKLYAGFDSDELNMVFQFEHVQVDQHGEGKWDHHYFEPVELKKILFRWQRELDGKAWNSIYLMNHDQPRALSRFGNDGEFRKEAAKCLAMLTLTLQGTPYIFQGEEIGMTNAYFDSIEHYRDIESHNFYTMAREKGMDESEIFKRLQYVSRDNSRTPMQWDDSSNAGFTTGKPWIDINPNYKKINVLADRKDPESIFNFYSRMINLRKTEKALIHGTFKGYLDDDPDLYVYQREYENNLFTIVLNFTEKVVSLVEKDLSFIGNSTLLISNYKDNHSSEELRPFEARMYKHAE
jgi:oligo-1,6-glucosidase